MIHNLGSGTESPFALIQTRVHVLQFGEYRSLYFVTRRSSRNHALWGFRTTRQIAQPQYQHFPEAVLDRCSSTQWPARSQTFGDCLVGVLIGQIKMFQNLRGGPLPCRIPVERILAQTAGHTFKFLAQAFKM